MDEKKREEEERTNSDLEVNGRKDEYQPKTTIIRGRISIG